VANGSILSNLRVAAEGMNAGKLLDEFTLDLWN